MSGKTATAITADRATSLSVDGGATLTEAAYDALRVDIIRGLRAPGERLRIERLSKLYNVGPTPLREALQRLSADGLVAATGNRGFSVTPLDFDEFTDLNIARTALETEALRLSIAKGCDEWEAGVVSAAWRMAKADATLMADGGASLDQWERTNAAFHLAMVSACGSNWLLRLRQGLHDQCERYRRAAVYLKRGLRDLKSEHAAIAEAVLARDTDRACTLTAAHFAATVGNLDDELRAGPASA